MAKLPPKIGRPPIFKNSDELLRLFMEYVEENVIEKGEICNKAGFRRKFFIPKSTLFEYEGRKEFSDAFEIIEDVIEDDTLNNKNIETAIRIQIMKSKLGYVDMSKVETKNENTNIEVELTPEQREKRIQELLEKMKG